jgi:intein/homing endonuclease
MTPIFKENTKNLKVLTADGYQSFKGIQCLGERPIYRLEFENENWIECTDNHQIFIDDGTKIDAAKLKVGDNVMALGGDLVIIKAYYTGRIEKVYDLVGVDGGNRFYGNDILVSNCEFIAFDETLISAIFLSEMDMGMEPMRKHGQVRWYDKIRDDQTYLVALDPSLGTGGDPSAIQIFAIPGMRQVGEWQHNKTPIQMQIKIMRAILEEIEEAAPNSELYYSVENNTLGEAALVTIEEMGEEHIPGTFLSEPKKKGKGRRFRKGFNTTNSNKLASCAKLKRWVEESTMKVRSKNLTRELKTFVAHGNGYKAKEGETDDLVMATILAIRMAMQVARYDPEAFDDLKESFDDSDLRRPMPVGFLN